MRCTECKDFFCKHRSQSTTGGECFYESKEQTEKLLAITTEATFAYVDWSAFRREAAKDILVALCNTMPINMKEDVSQAINIADELVKQLKKEQK